MALALKSRGVILIFVSGRPDVSEVFHDALLQSGVVFIVMFMFASNFLHYLPPPSIRRAEQ
jgi:hypothetical protein